MMIVLAATESTERLRIDSAAREARISWSKRIAGSLCVALTCQPDVGSQPDTAVKALAAYGMKS